jgi:hypothetical protein
MDLICAKISVAVGIMLRKEHWLRLFKNKVLRKVFGTTREKVTGDWRKLRSEELHDLYCSPNIIRMFKSRIMKWAGHVECMGEKTNPYRVLVGKPEETIWKT